MRFFKKLVAEIIGDGRLFEEGRKDVRRDGATMPQGGKDFTPRPRTTYEAGEGLADPRRSKE